MTQDAGSGHPTPSTATPQHRAAGPKVIRAAILTISDTRTPETDTSGEYLTRQLREAGHEITEYVIVKDDAVEIRGLLTRMLHKVDLIVTTGGTGIAGRDVTIPVIESMIVKPIPGFGELFRMLSYQQVGGAAMLSRATGGLTRGALLFALPGSLNAVQTAWEGILKDELGHLVFEVARQGQPGSLTPNPQVAALAQPAQTQQQTQPAQAAQTQTAQTQAAQTQTAQTRPAQGQGVQPPPAPLSPEDIYNPPHVPSSHVNQGAAAGIGRHGGGDPSGPAGGTSSGLGRHANVGAAPPTVQHPTVQNKPEE